MKLENEITILSGPSGSGKTTKMKKMIMNCEKQSMNISYVPQENMLLESLTLEKNIMNLSKMGSENVAESILVILNLEQHNNKKIKYFSTGMKRRAQLAVGLSNTAKCYFFDEPFANIDDELSRKIVDYLSQLSKYNPVVIITHKEYLFDDLEHKLVEVNDFK